MEKTAFRLTVLGTRGSMAVNGSRYDLFGGATSCYLAQAGEDSVFLDAGSGLIQAPVAFPRPPAILISHLHLDHLLGLGMYPRMVMKGLKTLLYVPVAPGKDPEQVLNSVYSPPFWPVSLSHYSGDIAIRPLAFPLQVGEIRVDGMEGNHPGGCAAIKLSWREKRIVYLTDYEYSEESFGRLTAFAAGCDLLLFDGQYTAEEADRRHGFGHSTADWGMEMMRKSGARRLLLVHHDPQSTDEILLAREKAIGRANVRYARNGEVILL